MNTLKHDAQSRTKEDIETIRHLYLDIDRNGPTALEAIENSGLVPRPNYVLETFAGKVSSRLESGRDCSRSGRGPSACDGERIRRRSRCNGFHTRIAITRIS